MQIKQPKKSDDDVEKQLRQKLQTTIGGHVMHILGQPDNLHLVQVRKLWGESYRVNVFTGLDAASAVISDSYFLTTDAQGGILSANPSITKKY